MIRFPKPGMRVELHYKNHLYPRHLQLGKVLQASKGPGPISALVELDNGEKIIVPRGQLFIQKGIENVKRNK